MVQGEILSRVLRIRYNSSLGTAFTIESHGEQFLVTAKHIFGDTALPSSAIIGLLLGEDYQLFDVDIRYPSNQVVDIAVIRLKVPQYLTPTYDNINSTEGLILGQDVFFLGFPFEYDSILQGYPNRERPLPFIKKACMSAILKDSAKTILLDGINNPGFSGGPVCFKKIGSMETTMRILGVVSAYRTERQPLLNIVGSDTRGYYVPTNTGIILVYDIKNAIVIADNWT